MIRHGEERDFEKAVYKDIDKIEENRLKSGKNQNINGKKVTFTNSVGGLDRMIYGGDDSKYPKPALGVCLVTRKNETNPYVEKMKEFILSDQGQEIIRKTGYAGVKR